MTKFELKGIELNYKSFNALKGIDLKIKESEIHALIGEHGAGKSSLAHLIAGILKPSSGSLYFRGEKLNKTGYRDLMKAGIRIVTQNNPLHDNMSVAENILIDFKGFRLITKKGEIKKAKQLIEEFGFSIDVSRPLEELKLADRALVDILRNLIHKPKLLILDETLEKLSINDHKKIIKILKKEVKKGLSLLFISHRVDDIYNVADRVTIIRDGKKLLTERVDNIDKVNLIRLAYTFNSKELNSKERFNQLLRYNEAILRDLPVPLFVLDNRGIIRVLNRSSENLLGKKVIGKSIHKFIPDGDIKFLDIINNSIGSKESTNYYQIPLKDGVFNITTYPTFERATLMGNIIIMVDITEEERLREQVILSENLASVGLLGAGVAHEINNPLDIMGYYLERLRFSDLTESQLKTLNSMEEEITSIAQIVSNLISFSDKVPREISSMNIFSLVDTLVNLLNYRAEESNIKINWENSFKDIRVMADKNEIKQVLLNITRNAFDAMPEGGKLDIEITRDDSMVNLVLKDSGPGIPEDKLKNIFLPFYSTKEDSGRNMGLGLSLSYGIIKKYNGDLLIKNGDKEGCHVSLKLPLALS